ncbi:MAG: amidohydrolase [Methanoregula sp.]|nr:amidohydrolase [Methanoregula sp.]
MRSALVLLLLLIAITLGTGCSQQGATPAMITPTLDAGIPAPLPPTATPAPSTAGTVAALVTTTAKVLYTGTFIDAHAHIQPSSMSYDKIIRLMDEHRVDRMVVMEPPGAWIEGAMPSAYGVPDAAARYPDRFTVLYSGDAGTMLYEATKNGIYTPEQEKKFTVLLDEALASGKYRGIGEIGLRHLPPKGRPATYDLTIPADHPWMFIMSDTAARYGVPLDLHLQAGDTDLTAFERLLDHNKNTIIIWDHAGDHTQNMNPDTLRSLLAAHKNLYTSIKVRTGESQPQGGIMMEDTGSISNTWQKLITDYPDRFIIGTDVKLGILPNEIRFVDDHTSLLSQLPPDVAQKVAQENPKRIFRL